MVLFILFCLIHIILADFFHPYSPFSTPILIPQSGIIPIEISYECATNMVLSVDLLQLESNNVNFLGNVHVNRMGNAVETFYVKMYEKIEIGAKNVFLNLWSVNVSIYEQDPKTAWKYASSIYKVPVNVSFLGYKTDCEVKPDSICFSFARPTVLPRFDAFGLSVGFNTKQEDTSILAQIVGNNGILCGIGYSISNLEGYISFNVSLNSNALTLCNVSQSYMLEIFLKKNEIILASNFTAISFSHNIGYETFLPPISVPIDFNPGDDFELVFNDEFDGSELSLLDWSIELGRGGDPKEIETYTNSTDNIRTENGYLVIEPRFAGFTSGRISTSQKHSFLFGKFAARIKVPYGDGVWPAFWLLGNQVRNSSVIWPRCGEIDIMELCNGKTSDFGGANKLFTTLHGSKNGLHGETDYFEIGSTYEIKHDIFGDEFHVYWADWNSSFITIGVDNKSLLYVNLSGKQYDSFRDISNPFFLILNVALGGWFPNLDPVLADFPTKMLVDYVRVYQQKSEFPLPVSSSYLSYVIFALSLSLLLLVIFSIWLWNKKKSSNGQNVNSYKYGTMQMYASE